jgi:hypothetical protein
MATTAQRCATLNARLDELIDQLAGLPVGGSVSEGGRSVTVSAAEIQAQIDNTLALMARFKCSQERIGDPAVIISRARA